MGVDIGELVEKKITKFEELSGKRIAIDAYNTLYQFLTTIRGPDGTPLMNRKGEVTSHLSGIFFRTCRLLSEEIKPVYVYDGKPPLLKREEVKKRRESREKARELYEEALHRGDMEAARVYAKLSTTLEDYMVETSKKVLELLGVPAIQAPAEGEAQAAYLSQRGLVWASASQDYDSLLFGAPKLLRNLAITGRRKLPGKKAYIEVEPELIYLKETLDKLGITREQLIEIGLIIGTDYTPKIRGVGPKTALKLIKKGLSAEEVYRRYGMEVPEVLEKAREYFMNPEVKDVEPTQLELREIDVEGVISYLAEEHDFNKERLRKALNKVMERQEEVRRTMKLSKWFK
ncbi:MAG TPA: flap endonuclease-1 [Candidatus Bathyarchaeota archaeon]|nr:flap endonuclease-1 [Candidatus Bathyarchaeota archaeon]